MNQTFMKHLQKFILKIVMNDKFLRLMLNTLGNDLLFLPERIKV